MVTDKWYRVVHVSSSDVMKQSVFVVKTWQWKYCVFKHPWSHALFKIKTFYDDKVSPCLVLLRNMILSFNICFWIKALLLGCYKVSSLSKHLSIHPSDITCTKHIFSPLGPIWLILYSLGLFWWKMYSDFEPWWRLQQSALWKFFV